MLLCTGYAGVLANEYVATLILYAGTINPTECNSDTTQKFSFGIRITVELKKYNNYIPKYRHTSQSKHTPLDASIVGYSCIF